jgi:hypothetical protein
MTAGCRARRLLLALARPSTLAEQVSGSCVRLRHLLLCCCLLLLSLLRQAGRLAYSLILKSTPNMSFTCSNKVQQ